MNTRRLHTALNLAFIFIFTVSLLGAKPVSAQTEPPTDRPAPGPAGLTYGYDSQTGLLNFVGGDDATPLLDPAETVGAMADVDAGAQVLAQFAPAFGLANPADELLLQKVDEHSAGVTLRYQQQYQGIPVLGGELLLNRDTAGKVLSLNGEVSPALTLRTTHPAVSAARARSTALAGMKTWYGLAAAAVQSSEPELWIYDPALFEPSDAAPVLVWRMVLTANAEAGPVNELVLVNAATGRVALHFNQVNADVQTQEEPPLDALYVSTTGFDEDNDCRSLLTPCQTPQHAVLSAQTGSTIFVEVGEYSSFYVPIGITLTGGWNADYTQKNGRSTIVGDYNQESIGLSITGTFTYIIGFTVRGFGTAISNTGVTTVSDSVIRDNITGFNNRGRLYIQGTTISQNASAIKNMSQVEINYSTIADNASIWLAQIHDYPRDRYLHIQNSVVARNKHGCAADSFGEVKSLGYNIFDTPHLCEANNGHHPTITTHPTDLYATDPQITPLISGSHHALIASSPAIDASDPESSCSGTDIRGVIRPVTGRCDIGAYEYTEPGAAAFIQAIYFESKVLDVLGYPYVFPFRRLSTIRPDELLLRQTTAPGLSFLYPLKVIVFDETLAPVPGASVSFSAPESGASAIFSPQNSVNNAQITDAYGVATSHRLKANDQTGVYDVTAILDSTSDSVKFQLDNGTTAVYVDASYTGLPSPGCSDPSRPCNSLDMAVQIAYNGQLLMLAGGVYTNPDWAHFYKYFSKCALSVLDKNVVITGDWDHAFTQQTDNTVLKGSNQCFTVHIANNGHTIIDHVDFSGSVRSIYNQDSHLEISNSRIYENQTGIYSDGGLTEIADTSITLNTFGINNAGTLKLSNSTISHNTCNEEGNISCPATVGLLNTNNGRSELSNVTIGYNRSFLRDPTYYPPYPVSSGLHNESGTVTIKNTILAFNLNESGYECSGDITSLGHNLLTNNNRCQIQAVEGDIFGVWDQRVDPLIGYLGDNGGGIETVPLLTGSPAIDHADTTACPQTDIRGEPRPAGAGCDMGSYEGSIESSTLPNIIIYTTGNNLYTTHHYLCETPKSDCTGGENPDADKAYQYLLAAYDFFKDRYGYVSLDNAAMPILATVNIGQSAAWTGWKLDFANNYVVDDVVMHEYAHGITQHTSHLLYYYQSGAISESYSDMWGEYYDQTNGIGNDSPEVDWLMGEELPNGAVRNMSDPTTLGQPDKMSNKNFWRKLSDNGGVHINSGVNNKAIYLMVQGGLFNGLSIAPLGWQKVLDLYYYTHTHLLTSGAGYDDLYMALNQGCSAMAGGAEGITEEDCMQVRKALDAVEMSMSHNSSFNPDATSCPKDTYQDPTPLFFDDFESGDDNWTFGALSGNPRWSVSPGNTHFYYAASGKYALYGDDYDPSLVSNQQVSNTYAAMTHEVEIPTKGKTMLYYKHSFGFEYYIYYYRNKTESYYIDGGILEYSTNNGLTWQDAKSLIVDGQKYGGKLYYGKYDGYNPFRNRYTFRGESHGYVASRLNLSKLAGKSVRFRWRLGTDYTGSYLGWAVDDVSIYTCVGKPATPSLRSPANGGLVTRYQQLVLDWKDASYAKSYDFQLASDPAFSSIVQNLTGLPTSDYTLPEPLTPNSRYYWRVRATNAAGIIGKWSGTRYFRTGMTPPVLDVPANESVATSVRPSFQWSGSPGATSYTLQVSKYASLSKPVFSTTVKTTSFTPSKNLSAATTYYWRVKANGANPSDWSQVFTFTTP